MYMGHSVCKSSFGNSVNAIISIFQFFKVMVVPEHLLHGMHNRVSIGFMCAVCSQKLVWSVEIYVWSGKLVWFPH
jgi:hypothetical protein